MPSADPPNHQPRVRLRPTQLPTTADVPLWTVIRNSTEAMSFDTYARAIDDRIGTSRHDLRGATELFMAGEGGDVRAFREESLFWKRRLTARMVSARRPSSSQYDQINSTS